MRQRGEELLDGSSTARAALEYALARGPVVAVYAGDDPLRGRELREQLLSGAPSAADAEFELLDRPPAVALACVARVREAT